MNTVYQETFDAGPGGWMTWLGHNRPAAPELVDGALISRSPWGIDSNHAPPGGGYLHLLFILFTAPQPNPGPAYRPLMAGNRFIAGGYSTDLRNARLTARLKGEVNLRGANLVLHCQSRIGSKAVNFVLTGQPFEITPDWSEQSVTLTTDPEQWLCLGARHDLADVYGWGEIEDVLRDVNIDIILLLHPLHIVPLTPEPQGVHYRRPEVDYPVDRSFLPEGYVLLDEVRIEYPARQ
ncbi:MAG: hypothetical protein DCC55_12425 [Chloroflexi bacterium]|nr:MAG: hypothetical protein DCC55_12425 [Chloroflexota bacterium]